MTKPVFFIFNNKNSYEDFGIKLIDEVIIPMPQEKITKTSIPGGEDLIEKDGGYEDISIPVKIDILNKNIIARKYRDIKRWLGFFDDNKLIFSNDTEVYYRVKEIQIPNFTTEFSECGSTTLTFICSPYSYITDGSFEINIPKILFNEYGLSSEPIFKIKAEGLVHLTINEDTINLNVGQEIIVDVEKQLIYKDGVINNQVKNGSWSSLKLKPGKNILSYTYEGTFESITITPNWRML